LPPGDVVFIRQVLQHLSNNDIALVISKLTQYRVLVVTEHLPPNNDFVPNVDISNGAHIRLQGTFSSGVVLTAPPFNLVPKHERVLCEVDGYGGVIRTTAYEQ
jgi:hypothetical protein